MATGTKQSTLNVAPTAATISTNIRRELLSRAELAAEFDVSLRTIDRWRSKRDAPLCVRIGKKIFWRRETVLQWIQAKEEKPLRRR